MGAKSRALLVAAALALAVDAAGQSTVEYVTPERPFTERVKDMPVGDVPATGAVRIPTMTWGGDLVTLFAAGGRATAKESRYGKAGLSLELGHQDDFVEQVRAYLAGTSPFLRGTLGMIHCASAALSRDPRTRPVIVLLLTWSTGGDALVVRPGIRQVKDLKGKRVVLQQYSAHIDWLDILLRDAGLTWADVDARFVPMLTAAPDWDPKLAARDPANAFRRDPEAAATCVISLDAMALTAGGPGGVKDARVLLSTKTATRIIADVLAVRADFLEQRPEDVRRIVLGWLQAAEDLEDLRTRGGPAHDAFLATAAEAFFGNREAIADVDGLLADCTLCGHAANVSFFQDESDLQNHARASARIQSFLVREKYLAEGTQPAGPPWDWKSFEPHLRGAVPAERPLFGDPKIALLVVERQTGPGALFEFEIRFLPNQQAFDAAQYQQDFSRVLDLASRYGGAVIEVVGHADPSRVGRLEWEQGENSPAVAATRQAARNLSLARANRVREAVIEFAAQRRLRVDASQFVTNGEGVERPRRPRPASEAEWLENMRVEFRVLNVEAERAELEK